MEQMIYIGNLEGRKCYWYVPRFIVKFQAKGRDIKERGVINGYQGEVSLTRSR